MTSRRVFYESFFFFSTEVEGLNSSDRMVPEEAKRETPGVRAEEAKRVIEKEVEGLDGEGWELGVEEALTESVVGVPEEEAWETAAPGVLGEETPEEEQAVAMDLTDPAREEKVMPSAAAREKGAEMARATAAAEAETVQGAETVAETGQGTAQEAMRLDTRQTFCTLQSSTSLPSYGQQKRTTLHTLPEDQAVAGATVRETPAEEREAEGTESASTVEGGSEEGAVLMPTFVQSHVEARVVRQQSHRHDKRSVCHFLND